jgi:hypothetical protein
LKRFALTALATASVLATTLIVAASVSAQNTRIAVQLNGNTLTLNPPAVERAGRVFVPLRGVFERMGATVVYDNGQINATGRGHNVSLNIGSNRAVVDGQTQMLDVAPFIIGASTYVPLRFLSQSLGVQVNWDNNNDVVMLSMAGGRYSGAPQYGLSGPNSQQPYPEDSGYQAYPYAAQLPSYSYAQDYSYAPGYPVYYPPYPVYYPYPCCYGPYYGLGIGIHIGGHGGGHGRH